jgi:hypothetical protein
VCWAGETSWTLGNRRRGLLPKNIDQQVGRRAVICKLFPPIAMAIRSRSCVFDESFYSLHNYLSFHLIHSQTIYATNGGMQQLTSVRRGDENVFPKRYDFIGHREMKSSECSVDFWRLACAVETGDRALLYFLLGFKAYCCKLNVWSCWRVYRTALFC